MHIDLQAVSGINGSISIAAWVVVFSPQIIENFRRSSAEGLSVIFVFIWLIGDVFNILGAVLQGVLPTMIILAVYYTLADMVLMAQCFYYRGFTLKDTVEFTAADVERTAPSEQTALLSSGASSPAIDSANRQLHHPLSERTRRRSSLRDQLAQSGTQLSPAVPMHSTRRDEDALKFQGATKQKKNSAMAKQILFNLAAVLVVIAAGVLGWWLGTRNEHPHHRKSDQKHDSGPLQFNLLGQIFGYVCAVLYLGSRVPQLLLNFRRKSTEGISMLFFAFACIGNATYVASIVAYEPTCAHPKHCQSGEAASIYWRYILVNLSWLLGSFGTLLLDAGVFVQYFLYRSNESTANVAVE